MSFFIARLETRHFDFEGAGSDEQQARAALDAALRAHAQQYDLQRNWCAEFDITVRPYLPGQGYRDATPITSI